MKLSFYLLSMLLVASAYAQLKVDKDPTKKVMHQALDSIIHLIPFMSSEMRFKDPKHEKEINLHLNKIATAFKTAKHVKDFRMPGFSPNFKVMKEHLDDTIMTFNSNNKTFARLRLNATTSICMSCHTQLPKDKMTSYILDTRKINRKTFNNEYEYGNFQFLLRSYRSAISSYQRSVGQRLVKRKELLKIKDILGSEHEHYDKIMFNSFKKILIIYAKILRSPEKAIKVFKKYINQKQLPKYMVNDLNSWVKHLNKWKDNESLSKKYANDAELQKFIKSYVLPIEGKEETIASGEFDVDLLVISGVLSNYLNENTKTELAPEILYWIGVTENRLGKNLFFTIGDLYLKECITRYPNSPTAKKCFQEYKNEVTFRFTGSIGTNIPASKQKELKRLENLIK
jgi:hypothetical protein